MAFRMLATLGISILLVITVILLGSSYLDAETVRVIGETDEMPPKEMLFGHDAETLVPIIGWSGASVTVVLTWLAVFTTNPRLRFEVPFWSGVVLLAAVYRYVWVCASKMSLWAYSGDYAPGFMAWPCPLICAYETFVALLLIIWAIQRSPFQRRGAE